MSDIVLRTNKLTKTFNKYTAVNAVDIEIKRGEIYGFVGKNGAGKTTLLRMLCGLSLPTSGGIEILGEASHSGLMASRTRMGTIIETPSFFPYLSAEKNLEYYRIQKGIPERSVVKESLELVGLSDTGNKKFKNFSLGMKQRMGLALAIMAKPDLLLLDEPINGLDPTGIAEFRNILLKLNKEKNITIIISSHILEELSHLATSYGFIDKGNFLEQISAQGLHEKCKKFLSIKVKNVEIASSIIETQLKSKKYKVLNNNEIRLYDYLDTPEIPAEALVKNGAILQTISSVGTSLENYFIDLIGGNKND
ncbi:ABC transporter ATP-binding protein [Clostridium oryzae]|uniref:Putative ABC transporter ATP-binding protein YxlF n=1 Tax=Clostridium oryzae TaxID=1450648 RepID=A0A1V4ID86_9CLOT|nr:ATP-binding cassette domain-containing protein [Clostridium oryzae]OPJ57903.1 putative ABC transporter ATP-binding protein YxlF [Clostridium oryzae]